MENNLDLNKDKEEIINELYFNIDIYNFFKLYIFDSSLNDVLFLKNKSFKSKIEIFKNGNIKLYVLLNNQYISPQLKDLFLAKKQQFGEVLYTKYYEQEKTTLIEFYIKLKENKNIKNIADQELIFLFPPITLKEGLLVNNGIGSFYIYEDIKEILDLFKNILSSKEDIEEDLKYVYIFKMDNESFFNYIDELTHIIIIEDLFYDENKNFQKVYYKTIYSKYDNDKEINYLNEYIGFFQILNKKYFQNKKYLSYLEYLLSNNKYIEEIIDENEKYGIDTSISYIKLNE